MRREVKISLAMAPFMAAAVLGAIIFEQGPERFFEETPWLLQAFMVAMALTFSCAGVMIAFLLTARHRRS